MLATKPDKRVALAARMARISQAVPSKGEPIRAASEIAAAA